MTKSENSLDHSDISMAINCATLASRHFFSLKLFTKERESHNYAQSSIHKTDMSSIFQEIDLNLTEKEKQWKSMKNIIDLNKENLFRTVC